MALVFSTNKLRHCLLNVKVHVVTKLDPLKYVVAKIDLSRHLAKWVMLLTEYDLKFVSQKSIKGQALTDHLVDTPSPLAFPSHDSFLDENVLKIDENET